MTFLVSTGQMIPLIFWNVRGLHRPLVNTVFCKYQPAICELQEAHFMKKILSCLRYFWTGYAYHSVYSSIFRGVSILLHRSLDFQELASIVDVKGSYIFIHCKLYTVTCILAMVYSVFLFHYGIKTITVLSTR